MALIRGRFGRLVVGLFVLFCAAAVVALAATAKLDLDGNPANGAESTVETNVLQSYPVVVENVVFNNALGMAFSFDWPGAGPGGFGSILTTGPDVGTKWEWSTVSQVYTIQASATFVESGRQLPAFGQPSGGFVTPGGGQRSFTLPGKSIFPTQVTVSSASLTASLITFFSPENTIATCESTFAPGVFTQTITNTSGEPLTLTVEQPDCCLQPNQIICEDGCQSYLTDVNNCGDCGVQCAYDEFCDEGSCAPICPGPGELYCNGVCVDSFSDPANCGGCGITCANDEYCDLGSCAPICPGPGELYCDGVCIDSLTDPANCGACGNACAFDEYCDQGTCAPICPGAGQLYCSGICIDSYNDLANCGGCGVICAYDEYCDQGTCSPICPAGLSYCGGACVDLQNDPLNCGACGNSCGNNQICEGATCSTCLPPQQTACNNVCVNIHTDPFNCGSCGNVCDFSDCPSEGQGTCSMGNSCLCDPVAGESANYDTFEPTPVEPPVSPVVQPLSRTKPRATRPRGPRVVDPKIREARPASSARIPAADLPGESGSLSEDGGERPSRPGVARLRGRALAEPVADSMAAPVETSAAIDVVEAPVCEFQEPIVTMTIPDGGTFSQCQIGALIGQEVFTRATVMRDGKVAGAGPCAVVVPAPDLFIDDFYAATSSLVIIDDSGDGLLQPGEQADLMIELVNVGPLDLVDPVATLAGPADAFNTSPVTILNGTASYPDFPEYDNVADCTTPPVLAPQQSLAPFRIQLPDDQEADVSRALQLSIQGTNVAPVTFAMPIIIGVGEKCDPANLDGESFDGLDGFLTPLEVRLVPRGTPVQYSDAQLNQGSNVPLKVRVKCGSTVLSGSEIDPAPQIVEIEHETLGPLPLININADNSSNPDNPFFDCSTNRCEYGLRSAGLPVGRYVISIKMADSRIFQAGFTIVS